MMQNDRTAYAIGLGSFLLIAVAVALLTVLCGGCKSVCVQVTVNLLTTRSTALSSSATATNNAVKTSMVVSGGGANSNSATIPASIVPGLGVRQ